MRLYYFLQQFYNYITRDSHDFKKDPIVREHKKRVREKSEAIKQLVRCMRIETQVLYEERWKQVYLRRKKTPKYQAFDVMEGRAFENCNYQNISGSKYDCIYYCVGKKGTEF